MNIVGRAQSESNPDGSITTRQVADVVLPRTVLDSIWSPEYLERLARTYWRFLTRVSLGLLRVLYTPTSREVVLIRRPLRLLTFHAPLYDIRPNRGSVSWPINRGLLVAPNGPQSLAEVELVYSHPQPLAQSRGWLQQNLPHVAFQEASSTARARANPRCPFLVSRLPPIPG